MDSPNPTAQKSATQNTMELFRDVSVAITTGAAIGFMFGFFFFRRRSLPSIYGGAFGFATQFPHIKEFALETAGKNKIDPIYYGETANVDAPEYNYVDELKWLDKEIHKRKYKCNSLF